MLARPSAILPHKRAHSEGSRHLPTRRDYELSFHKEWEELLTKQSYTTARDLEKAMRGDLTTPDCSRMGNKFVRDYIAAHPEKFKRYGQLPGAAPRN